MKKTVIIGATPNTTRYASLAAERLKSHAHPIIPLGIKTGFTAGKEIINLRDKPPLSQVHTVTMYIGAQNQIEWINYILGLKPKRIIFNPGTENPQFERKAHEAGIETIQGCTLVMLSAGTY